MIVIELGIWIIRLIKDFIASSLNRMNEDGEPAWGEPLVGFSNGADPLYKFYKEDIGAFYFSPVEVLTHDYPGMEASPSGVTIISWILPQTEVTKKDHRIETHFPSERWARSRIFGEEVNSMLREEVVTRLKDKNIEAVAPMLSPLWKRETSLKYGFASSWSERHAAYVAGLGTFGLSDGLITAVGKAMRCGSVVANTRIQATVRPYYDHNEYCLFYDEGACGECIKRCPIGAISRKGHNKDLCSKYVSMTRVYVSRHYGFDGYGCGLCQTDVPCESGIPNR